MSRGQTHLQYSIDPRKAGAPISPLLFGHNLEHTRSCMWQGLSAQLIRNRKFAEKPQQLNGVAMEWYPIGPPQTYFLLDEQVSYTQHYCAEIGSRSNNRRRNEIHSQFIQACIEGERCGIGQDNIPVEKGRDYTLRLAIKSTNRLTVNLALVTNDRGAILFDEQTSSEQWQVHEFDFSSAKTDLAARLEITFNGVADLHVGFVSLIPSNSFYGMRQDVIALLKEIGSPILRWPGGNFAGDYRWKDGLLDPDVHAPLKGFQEIETLPHTFGFDFHELGTDEFVALCREVGAEPFISINLAWDSPEECAGWVEYCNGTESTEWGKHRAKRGEAQPYGVKYWSLGNELGYGHMEGPNDAGTYAEKAVTCARAMRDIDPSIALVMAGQWQKEEWFTDGLATLAPDIDHIAYHQYDPALSTYLGQEAKTEFARLVSIPSRTLEGIKSLRAKINQVTPEGKFIGISFDEWNVWYAWYRTPGVAEGIHAAGMLNTFSRISADAGVSIGCFFEPINEGAIVVEPFSSRLTPAGQVFSLYKAHHGNRFVEATCSSSDEPVDVIASIDQESGSLVVTLVNGSPDTEADVRLSFPVAGSISLSDGVLLASENFLPASVFETRSVFVEDHDSNVVSVRLPKHSVAQLVLSY